MRPDRLDAIKDRLAELAAAPSKGFRVVAENDVMEHAAEDLAWCVAEIEQLRALPDRLLAWLLESPEWLEARRLEVQLDRWLKAEDGYGTP